MSSTSARLCLLSLLGLARTSASLETGNSSLARAELRFVNLCNDERNLCGECTSETDSPGLWGSEYAVVGLEALADWTSHMRECSELGKWDPDNVYRLALIESMKENNCLATWLADKYAALGVREYAIGLTTTKAPEPSDGGLTHLYNIWEWGYESPKAIAESLTITPPWNWEGGRGAGDCATIIVGNLEQNSFWRRRQCIGEAIYGLCERHPA